MPKIPFGTGAYRRDSGDLPEVRVVNMFAERTPTAEGGVTLLSREGLSEYAERGNGPVQGIFCDPGNFGGSIFVVSGGTLYKDGTSLGTVAVTGPVSFASSGTELVLTGGTIPYSYNGTNLAAISLPDTFDCLAVDFLSSRFLFLRSGSQKFYWSALLNGRSVNSLHFASAESASDGLLDLKVIRSNLFLFGRKTVEAWRTTGNSDLPYQLIAQNVQSKGIIATGCVVEADNAPHFIAQDGLFCRLGEIPERMSDSGIEEKIVASASRKLVTYDYEGHTFIIIRLDDEAYAFDAQTRQFHSLESYDLDIFRALSATNIGPTAYLGDDTTGQVWTFDGWDDDGDPVTRLFTAYFPINSGTVAIDNLWIEANVGRTDLLAGQGSDPVVEMRYSRDAGATWSDWEAAPLGEQGEYRTIPEWRALGSFDAPGAMFEFRVTDPVGFRVSGVHVNDPIPGRSR